MCRRITELVSRGSFQDSLLLYKHLHSSGIHGTPATLPSLLKACSSSPQSLPFALQLHCTILKTGHISDTVTINSLLSMYSKNSLVDPARLLFDTSPLRDSVTWNSMITCYTRNGFFSESIELFNEMHLTGLVTKPEVVAAVLSACGQTGNLGLGKAVHARAILNVELDTCILLPTSLVDMYWRCHDFDAAIRVFTLMPERNVVSWTAMITGCVMNEKCDLSLQFFRRMVEEGIRLNRATLVSALPACGELGALKHGKEIHGHIFRHGFESEPRVGGALIDMYSGCQGAFRLALLVFERTQDRDVVTWSSMIRSSSRSGHSAGAMKLFQQMQGDGVKPNYVTMLAVIATCLGLESLGHGQGSHGFIVKSGLQLDVFVGNSLIDMYAKCGCLESSVRIFAEMAVRDSISYSCMIAGYGLHGHGYDALRLFDKMKELGIETDGITFLAVLSACNHSGLIDEAIELFDPVKGYCDITPSEEHYACYVDLLGRSGRVEDACEVIRSMPMKPSMRILSSLGSACRIHGRSDAAERLALWLIDSEPDNAANYTLLAAIYAETCNWDAMEEVRTVMKERRVTKDFGSSRIEDGNKGCCLPIV